MEACAAFKGAETEVYERALRVEILWKRTTTQLDFIRKIWEDLDGVHQQIQEQILQVLTSKLNNINKKFEKLDKKSRDDQAKHRQLTKIKRAKYVLIKQGLDEAIDELSSWQELFDPSWFLTVKVSGPSIDRELSKSRSTDSSYKTAYSLREALREKPLEKLHVFLPKEGLDTARMRNIPFATAKCIPRAGEDKWHIVDSIPFDREIDLDLVTKDVRELARRLSSVDPLTFGMLQCHGVIRVTQPINRSLSSFDFVFKIPEELSNEPRSLRSYLLSNPNHSLTDRFQLAKQLAKSISYVHMLPQPWI